MGILTEEMKRVITEIQLCYAATVTPDGKPNMSPKGSITVLSDDELGFADLAYPGTIENLRHNSAIELTRSNKQNRWPGDYGSPSVSDREWESRVHRTVRKQLTPAKIAEVA